MKRVGVISDTHIPVAAEDLPLKVYNLLDKCDVVLHAGDFVDREFYKNLEKKFNLIGVYGNMDSEEVKEILNLKRTFKIEELNIGLIHGRGGPGSLMEYVRGEFEGEELDVIIFGHSHQALSRKKDNILLFNPGSPTDKIFAPYRSIGILNIEGKNIDAEIIKL